MRSGRSQPSATRLSGYATSSQAPGVAGGRGIDEPSGFGPAGTLSLLLDLEFLGVGNEADQGQRAHTAQGGEDPGQVHPREDADQAGRNGDPTQATHQHGAPIASLLAPELRQIGPDLG